MPSKFHTGLAVWDYQVVVIYAACMLGIGVYYARRQTDLNEYFLGGRRMHPVVVGISTMATLISTITYLTTPGEIIKNGFGILWAMLSMTQAGTLPPESAAAMQEALAQMNADMGPSTPVYAQEMTLYLGSYASIVAHRTGEMLGDPVFFLGLFFWETIGLMLIGMALFKSNMLTGEWEASRYRKWAITCFLVAAPTLAGLALYQMQSGYDAVAVFGSTIALSVPFDTLMTVGWAALIMLLIKTAASNAVRARLAAAGRMAFTNYLVTSIAMTTIFYGYGLGLFGSVGRLPLYLFCIGMWTALLLWSKPWLDRFQYGPFEWLWRSLSRWQVQPMNKA